MRGKLGTARAPCQDRESSGLGIGGCLHSADGLVPRRGREGPSRRQARHGGGGDDPRARVDVRVEDARDDGAGPREPDDALGVAELLRRGGLLPSEAVREHEGERVRAAALRLSRVNPFAASPCGSAAGIPSGGNVAGRRHPRAFRPLTPPACRLRWPCARSFR